MAGDDSTPRPGTTASIERRVERLEQQQDALQQSVNALATAVEIVRVEQGHAKELMGAKFSMLETSMTSLTAKFDALIQSIQLAMSDIGASPAGRQGTDALKRVHDRIDEVEKHEDDEHHDFETRLGNVEELAKSNRDWIIRAGGVLALAVFLATLFAPAIRAALGFG